MVSDSDLIRRVQGGERELFGELHARHHERVFRYIAYSVWQREAAQDIASEVWLKAYRAVDDFAPRDENSVAAWLLRIAGNSVTDYRRRLKPQVSLNAEEEPSTLQLTSPSAEGEALRQEKIQEVRRALGRLSEGDRRIIYLAHQDDLSCAQIAHAMHKPSISAVTSHLHRAMRHLKEMLQQSAWFDEEAAQQDINARQNVKLRKVAGGR
jgi:RNA polymerase sigma-70 factor (ECF subfamily)